MADTDYEARVHKQILQYANISGNMHALDSQIGEYYKDTFTRESSRHILGASSHIKFYANYLEKSIKKTGVLDILSVGSGDGSLEIQVAKEIEASGVDFSFHLMEISPILIEKAKERVASAGYEHKFNLHEVDLNNWQPDRKYSGIMAHHSLHHINNLEGLFDGIQNSLLGYFCSMDMIGRNGHMRWPETLEIIQRLWGILPVEKRKHYGLAGYEEEFLNWDCSKEGFEGIRAQDILPELIKRFGFISFYAFGGLIDPFIGRGFRRHYDVSKVEDRAFIDLVGYLNELLIDLGHIKPTQMAAVMVCDRTAQPLIHKHRTPEFCVRVP